MNFISYLSSGWNLLFPPSLTVTQQQDLRELEDSIATKTALIILRNNYMQQSPHDWEEVVFTQQFEEQFPDQLADKLVKVFSKAAYKPRSCLEMKNIALKNVSVGVREAKFAKASIRVEEKSLHAHQVLSDLAWNYSYFYAKNFIYNTLVDPTWVYDEEKLNNFFIAIENLVESSMRDIANCIDGIGVGYLLQAGFTRDSTAITAEPIDFEEIFKIDVPEAIDTDTMPPYLDKLLDKVPDRLSNFIMMQREYGYLLKAVGQTQETPQHLAINEFISKKIDEIYEKIFFPRTRINPRLTRNNWFK